MGEHRIPRKLGPVPGNRAAELAPPKFVHVSKELHMEPIMEARLDAYGKIVPKIVGYKFVLYRGLPYRGRTRPNDWGAEPCMLHRDRSDAAYQVRLAQEAAAAELL